jgi:hypothetical protein
MPEIWLKREDLNHTGAHKINNALGQALLCKRMGKTRIIAETGAGQHGVATVRGAGTGGAGLRRQRGCRGVLCRGPAAGRGTGCARRWPPPPSELTPLPPPRRTGPQQATVCARLGLHCIVYMGAKDMERQVRGRGASRLGAVQASMRQRPGADARPNKPRAPPPSHLPPAQPPSPPPPNRRSTCSACA